MFVEFVTYAAGTGLEVVLLATAIAATATSTVLKVQEGQQRSEAERIRRRQISLRERRERARIQREQQLAAARIRAGATAAGISPGASSSVTGGIQDTQSQLNRNLTFLGADTRASLAGSRALSNANSLSGFAAGADTLAQFGFAAFSNSAKINRVFGFG